MKEKSCDFCNGENNKDVSFRYQMFLFVNINLALLNNELKEKTAIVKSFNLDAPKVTIVGKNKIRWEYSDGRGFEITLTELQ